MLLAENTDLLTMAAQAQKVPEDTFLKLFRTTVNGRLIELANGPVSLREAHVGMDSNVTL